METTLAVTRRRLRRWRKFLHNAHPYRGDVVDALEKAPINGAQLSEYIACSAPVHLLDGWSYLSRAFDSMAHGDRSAAIHLGYYAELRAAMSLLATEGIGVFNRHHVAIDAGSGARQWKGPGTHVAAWELLTAWASEQGRTDSILTAIRVESRSVVDWLDAVGVSANIRPTVASDWLEAWSIDLKDFSADRSLRNEMSYRPSRIRAPEPPPITVQDEIVSPMFESWQALEPSSDRSGVSLDVALLRRAMEHVFTQGWAHATWEDFVNRLDGIASQSLLDFLLRADPPGAYVFHAAGESRRPTDKARPILARAMLLLRLAAASNAHLLSAAGVSKGDLAFWWEGHGMDSGLWNDSIDVDSFADLWSNVDQALSDATEKLNEEPKVRTVCEATARIGRFAELTQFNRAPLWLLSLD